MLVSDSKKEKVSPVHQPHDKLIKKLLSNTATARDILSLYLPKEVLEIADLNYLDLQRDSFIDDEHRAFAVDLLFKTKFQHEDGYIWILLEHQSSVDPWLPVRIFKYIALVWEHLRSKSKKATIPLVYPLIIYNGQRPYTSSLNLKDLIQPKASQKVFDNLFNTPFQLIDLTQIKDETLREHMQDHIRGIALLMTLKHIFDKNLQHSFETVLLEAYKSLDRAGNRDDLGDMLYYILNNNDSLNKNRIWSILNQEFSHEVGDRFMTVIEQWKLEGKLQGRLEGILEGRQEGRQEGKIEAIEMIAMRLLSLNADLEFIAKATGLSLEKIETLKANTH